MHYKNKGPPKRSLRGAANWNFTYLDNGNVNFPDNKKYSRSKPTIIRIPPTTLMPIRLTLLFFIILFAKTNSSAPTTIIKTDINGYMSFLLSTSDLYTCFNAAKYCFPNPADSKTYLYYTSSVFPLQTDSEKGHAMLKFYRFLLLPLAAVFLASSGFTFGQPDGTKCHLP